jgi:hypothetical protein
MRLRRSTVNEVPFGRVRSVAAEEQTLTLTSADITKHPNACRDFRPQSGNKPINARARAESKNLMCILGAV